MGVALYRKYRSRSLDDVVGQEHVTTLLRNALSSGKTSHAYLFTGPRGVGKTSIARILAHEINGLPYDDESNHLDIIEIDAASNNGVEDIRDLRDRVQIAPVSAKKKVYIIDEVHMLSKQAFNALLKTLEEPPEHVVFILATTDIDKVPETIISRTQRHTFRSANEVNITKNLQRIAKAEKVTVDDDALKLIARHAEGSFRDSVSLFDQLVSGANGTTVTVELVTSSLGLAATETMQALLTATLAGNIQTVNEILTNLEQAGVPPRTTASQLAHDLRIRVAENADYARLIDGLLDVSKSHYPELKLLTVLGLHAAPESAATEQAPQVPKTIASSKPTATITSPKPKSPKASKPTDTARAVDAVAVAPLQPLKSPTDFNWEALVAHVRTHHVALHSVLSKCEPELDDTTLKLYTKSAFYKKKLDDLKYRTLLLDSLTAIGYSLDIETIANAKPMKDSQAAQVAAIMGGGEEVSVEDA
ncbi:DNA polymerase III subunit gamma/tau [Candidatus Saccharibacteria bacterium]|nr:DNA polymerase III subunit gamma/tau [Candidatus Saccharibacteria bacterium]